MQALAEAFPYDRSHVSDLLQELYGRSQQASWSGPSLPRGESLHADGAEIDARTANVSCSSARYRSAGSACVWLSLQTRWCAEGRQ